MKPHIIPVEPQQQHQVFRLLTQQLCGSGKIDLQLRGAFAYATLGGVHALADEVAHLPIWGSTAKKFVIGVHHAITEPAALGKLCELPEAEVRAFVPGGRLSLSCFDASPVFHPKVLALSRVTGRRLTLLQAGSMNMTASALGAAPQNFEFALGLSAESGLAAAHALRFERWWSKIWSSSQRVDPSFLDRYAKLRETTLDANPILRSAIQTPPSIATAENFFIEVGAGSGPPGLRHQVEFPESLAVFFGPVRRARRDLVLEHNGQRWTGRPLSYKKTTFGVEIWRLGMPTQHAGGEPISQRAIRFLRTADADRFTIEVADVGSAPFRLWLRAANRRGHLGATHGIGARRYGFY